MFFYPSAAKMKLENGRWEKREELNRHAASAGGISSGQLARLGEMLAEFSQAEGSRLVGLAEQSQGWGFLGACSTFLAGGENFDNGHGESGYWQVTPLVERKEGVLTFLLSQTPHFCQKVRVRGKPGKV